MQAYKVKNILIAGGAGFIGSHICERLLLEGHNVICIDNFLTSNIENIRHLLEHPNFVFLKHDLSIPIDYNKIPELDKFKVRFQGIQEIYNFACPMVVKDYSKYIIHTLVANSLVVKNLLDTTIIYKAKILQASTSAVYGEAPSDNLYYEESTVGQVNFIGPKSAYYEGKRFAESMVMNYHNVYNIDMKIARIFNTYGPRMSLTAGTLLPEFILNALDNKDIIIYGDPGVKQSYCYITDMVDALVKLMDSEINGPVNIGHPSPRPTLEVAQIIVNILGSNSQVRMGEKLPFNTFHILPDINFIKTRLGWLPLVTFENGMVETIEYMRVMRSQVTMKDYVDQLGLDSVM